MKRILFIPDTHAPFVDDDAWAVMLSAAQEFQPDITVVLGDFFDFYGVSSHDKSPARKGLILDELRQSRHYLDEALAIGAKRNIFIEGNHEDRLRRYCWKKAPELEGMVDYRREVGLDKDWEFYRYGDGVWLGKLYCTHDQDLAGATAVRRTRERSGCNIVIGHVHRMGINYGGNAKGETHVGACFGWLGSHELADEYKKRLRSRMDFQHGFGIGYLHNNGNVQIHAVPIVNKSCVVPTGECVISL